MKPLVILAALLTLTACSKDSLFGKIGESIHDHEKQDKAQGNHNAALPASPALPSTLSKLFVPGAIGGNPAWVESMTGPAQRIDDEGDGKQTRTYQVDGCRVTANISQNTVQALSLDIGPTCTVSMQAMLPSEPAFDLTRLTFADVFNAGGASGPTLSCAGPSECGASTDPSISATLGGSHADGWLEVQFTGTILGDKDNDDLFNMMEEEGKRLGKSNDELTSDVYNADPQLLAAAQEKLGDVKVTSITFDNSLGQ